MVEAGAGPAAMASDGQSMWVANIYEGTVTKVEASNGTKLGTFPGRPLAFCHGI